MIITCAQLGDLPLLLSFRDEAAAWLGELGTDQWRRPYPADRLRAAVEAGQTFVVRDGGVTAATITLATVPPQGLWTSQEEADPALYISKLTVARTHAGQNLGGRLLNWGGDRAYRSRAAWVRLDAWTTNRALHRYYLRQGFEHVRTVLEGSAASGGPRVSGWLAQRTARPAEHGFTDRTPPV